MRPNPIPLIAALLLFSLSLAAQDDPRYNLLLKSGTVSTSKNITADKVDELNRTANRASGKSFLVIQFEQIPSEVTKQQLKEQGIELLDYIPNNAYSATITGSLNHFLLNQVKARSVIELSAQQKMQPELANGNFPAHAVKVAGTVDVWISFPKSFSFETVQSELQSRNFSITSIIHKEYRIIALRVAVQRLGELALLPFIEFVEAAPGADEPLNGWTNWGRDAVKVSLLNAPESVGGKNLKGTGVVIGIGDDADFQPHVDFTNRLITRAATGYGAHGTHVAGIAGGAGIRDELRTGFAPKSTIISQVFSNIFTNAPAYVADHGMVITNNSYGNSVNECATFGVYNLYSRMLDQQAIDLPNLQNVFAAGNSGILKCAPFPDSFRTVLGGYQSAKNVISVGNATPIGFIFQRSSRGPVRDGRIKPEIISVGSFIMSAGPPPFNFYYENTGTSMASPAISGGMGLLYEKYRLQNGGMNPKNGLMKTLVCNSGDDWGNIGPDYTHGFGVANFWRAVNMLENNRFATGNISTGAPQDIIVNVPAGLAELKVMLYWNDPAAAVIAVQTLVNNLDLEVITPASSTVLPLILDTAHLLVKNTAFNGVDNINNIEQVVIKNPTSGNHTIRIKPTVITQNPSQEYFVVYDFVPVETKLVAPIGGEAYLHGERIMIQWDSYGDPANTFTLEFYNGTSWTTLNSNLPAKDRIYFPTTAEFFTVPNNITTNGALVKVTRNGSGVPSSTSFPFVISDTINVSLSANQCEGYFSVDWTAVTGASDYEVMMLQGDEMVSVAIVPNNVFTYTISGLSKDSVYWVSVRPRIGTGTPTPGRRGLAISRKPNSGNCLNSISDNDIKVDSILSPLKSGRLLTSTALGSSVPVTIRIKNLDNVATTGNIEVSYTLSGAGVATATETISPSIAGGGTYVHTFNPSNNINLSAVGTYNLEINVTPLAVVDPLLQNNSLIQTYKQLPNPEITGINYPTPFVDNFDAAAAQSHTTPQIGLQDLDRYDFVNSSENGRLRTFVNTGIAYSGNRAITLDSKITNPGTTDSLTATFNLVNFVKVSDDIRLDFLYKNHGQGNNAANKVWIRSRDDQDWIEAYDLYANQNPVDGSFKHTASIEVSDLFPGAQDFSTSFQVRWGQYGTMLTADNDGGAGYTFDDIRLYRVTNDMQMISIDTPAVSSCALTTATQIKVTVRNSANTAITNVPVRFRIDGGSWLDPAELIPSIPANDTVQYTFIATANLSLPGTHTVETLVEYGTDSYRVNDTARITIVNSPVITVTASSPHLQNFEAGNGSWYTGGKNSSWDYGTPASLSINGAASGTKAWKTRITGSYNDFEKSYLYSPCYNVSSLTAPTLSFSLALDLEDCGAGLCDGAYMEYSLDGKNWDTLGANGQGTNWYNKNFASGVELWSVQNYTRWHVATIPLATIPVPINQLTQLRFRFVVLSDPAVNRDGVAIDDIHVYDNIHGIYDGITMGTPVTESIPGNTGWVNFISGTKLVASVNSPVEMGTTAAQVYIHTGPVRYSNLQFYHNRNITIKPGTVNLPDSATVRFYFLDTETEALINATGCNVCYKPSMAYELGISKYSDPTDANENGTLADNIGGNYFFITSPKVVKVPFDKGYYAEFKVKDFSEFWLNNGGFTRDRPLPVQLTSFIARKAPNSKDVIAEWVTASELNVSHFEIQVAKGNTQYQQMQFAKIGEVSSSGNSVQEQRYSFTDIEPLKAGIRYYRLKIIDRDGSFIYSPVRPVVFNEEIKWQVNPNPSTGIFNLTYQARDGESITVRVYDVSGKVVYLRNAVANGFVQKINIELTESKFANGLYMLEAVAGDKKQVFKLLKQ